MMWIEFDKKFTCLFFAFFFLKRKNKNKNNLPPPFYAARSAEKASLGVQFSAKLRTSFVR